MEDGREGRSCRSLCAKEQVEKDRAQSLDCEGEYNNTAYDFCGFEFDPVGVKALEWCLSGGREYADRYRDKGWR